MPGGHSEQEMKGQGRSFRQELTILGVGGWEGSVRKGLLGLSGESPGKREHEEPDRVGYP
jgi:hypothetical protein